MKNKWLKISLLLLMAWLTGCIDDKGNYDYLNPEDVCPVKISGLEDTYNFTLSERETLSVEVTGIDQEDNYAYTWYIMPAGMEATKTADTICRTKNLDWLVNCDASSYTMVFEVKDKRTGVYANKIMRANVGPDIVKGWFILKDENGMTDFDFIYPDGRVGENLLKSRAGVQVEGEARYMCYIPSNYYQEVLLPDGTVNIKRTKAFIVMGSKDLKIFSGENLSLFKNYEDAFYELPEKREPQWCATGFILNAGKLHSINTSSANVGKFGAAWLGDYDLYPEVFYGTQFFDRNTHSFYAAGDSYNIELVKLAEPTPDSKVQISPNNMDADLIGAMNRYALMKSTVDGKCFLLGITGGRNGVYPFESYLEIPAESRLIQAKVRAAHATSSCIYFGQGNELWSHSIADINKRENKIYTFPDNEEISYIVHINSLYPEKYSRLAIVTNSTAGWKIYRFEFDGDTAEILPNTAKDPVTGKGYARFVMYKAY